jgi:hypothetical protein
VNTSAPATVTITVGAPPAPSASPIATSHGTPQPTITQLTNVTQSHRTWRAGKHGGTTFSFTLNEAARVTFMFTQKNHRHSLGKLVVNGHPGRNRLAFDGLINRHLELKPGTYTVTITTGNSTPQRLTFTILK